MTVTARQNLISGIRTTTQTIDIVNTSSRGIQVVLDTTVNAAGSLVVTIDYYDPASGKLINLLTGAAVTGVATNTYSVHPNLAAAANVTVAKVTPVGTIRVKVTAGNSNNVTYSLGIAFLP